MDAICENFERDQYEYVSEIKHSFEASPTSWTLSALEDKLTAMSAQEEYLLGASKGQDTHGTVKLILEWAGRIDSEVLISLRAFLLNGEATKMSVKALLRHVRTLVHSARSLNQEVISTKAIKPDHARVWE